jgi:hypothetical protein
MRLNNWANAAVASVDAPARELAIGTGPTSWALRLLIIVGGQKAGASTLPANIPNG